MATTKQVKDIIDDMNKTITELRSKELLRDEKGISQSCIGKNIFEISYSDKNETGSIVFDKHISSSKIMDALLVGQQYTILLYDKGIFQAEFIVEGNLIIKERLVFMKKHNKIWDRNEIEESEILEDDWFDEDGVPIMLRIDYAPEDHQDGDHAATHLTISNHESCRIPIKGIVSFSEFVKFVLFHFYNIKIGRKSCYYSDEDTITDIEKQMLHLSWG